MKNVESKKQTLFLIVAVIAVLMFSTKAVFAKMAYKYQVDTITFLMLRMGISIPIFLAVWFVKLKSRSEQKPNSITSKGLLFIVFLGFIGYYLSSYFDLQGLQFVKASVERLILFIYPTLVLIFSSLLLKTKITKKQIVAITMSYIGVVFVFAEGINGVSFNREFFIGGTFVLLSALSYSLYLVGNQFAMKDLDAITFNSIAQLASAGFVVIHYFLSKGIIFPDLPMEVWGLGVLIAIVSTVIPSYLLAYSIKKIGASDVAIVASLGPISTIVLAMLLLDEYLSFYQVVGGSIIIVGVVTVTLSKKQKEKQLKTN